MQVTQRPAPPRRRKLSWLAALSGALVIRPGRSARPASTAALRSTERGPGRAAGPGTLLGPEGTGRTRGPPLDRTGDLPAAGGKSRDRPYLENCTVDASIIVDCQVSKGARWMPWHQEPMKDVGACDKPREV